MSFENGDIIVRAGFRYPEGALVVDGYNSDGVLLAHPMGGGLQLMIPAAEIPRFRIPDASEKTRVFHRTEFSIEGRDETFEGWSDGRRWNGWAMPLFEFVSASAVVAVCDPHHGHFDGASDSFVTGKADDEQEFWRGEIITLSDGSEAKVYPVGAGSWTWDEGEVWA